MKIEISSDIYTINFLISLTLTKKTTNSINIYQPSPQDNQDRQGAFLLLIYDRVSKNSQNRPILNPEDVQRQKHLPKISEIIAGDTLLLFLHLHHHPALHCRLLHLHLLMLHLHRNAHLRIFHAFADMSNDSGDIRVIFHHLLVVAATLIGRSGFNPQAHQHVDLEQPAIAIASFEEPVVSFQEVHVGCVLSDAPEGVVVVAVQVDPRWTLTEPPWPMLISAF